MLHFGRLSEVVNDPIATSLLKRLRKKPAPPAISPAEVAAAPAVLAVAPSAARALPWWEEAAHVVHTVYSAEAPRVGLLPLPTGVASAEELGSQPNFRVRVMPVLPPIPAAFGAALAAHVLALVRCHPSIYHSYFYLHVYFVLTPITGPSRR